MLFAWNYVHRVFSTRILCHSLGSLSQSEIIVWESFSGSTSSIIVGSLRYQVHRLVQNLLLHLIVHRSWLLAAPASQLAPDGGHTAAGDEEEKGYDPHPHLVSVVGAA